MTRAHGKRKAPEEQTSTQSSRKKRGVDGNLDAIAANLSAADVQQIVARIEILEKANADLQKANKEHAKVTKTLIREIEILKGRQGVDAGDMSGRELSDGEVADEEDVDEEEMVNKKGKNRHRKDKNATDGVRMQEAEVDGDSGPKKRPSRGSKGTQKSSVDKAEEKKGAYESFKLLKTRTAGSRLQPADFRCLTLLPLAHLKSESFQVSPLHTRQLIMDVKEEGFEVRIHDKAYYIITERSEFGRQKLEAWAAKHCHHANGEKFFLVEKDMRNMDF